MRFSSKLTFFITLNRVPTDLESQRINFFRESQGILLMVAEK